MFRHVPNAITGSRLFLAVGFFVLLAYYQYDVRGGRLLDVAFVVYLVALVTDFLDGYLARRWQVEGAFGRVVDPFVDKILVLGSLIFFGGKNFVVQQGQPQVLVTITGVAPWMVVLILGRELLVTSLRGVAEGDGSNFGAKFGGKAKMVLQSATILAILLYVNYFVHVREPFEACARYFRNACIGATIVLTLTSGWAYLRRAVSLYAGVPERRSQGRELGARV